MESDSDDDILDLVDRSVDWTRVSTMVSDCVSSAHKSIPLFQGKMLRLCAKHKLRSTIKHWIQTKLDFAKPLSPTRCPLEAFHAKEFPEEQAPETSKSRRLPEHLPYYVDAALPIYLEKAGILIEGVAVESSSADETLPRSMCAAFLYRQLWWWRCIMEKRVTTVYGFAVSCGRAGTRTSLSVTTMQMSVPDGMKIGARFQVCFDTRKGFADNTETIQSLFQHLGTFITQQTMSRPFDSSPIDSPYPGPAMILPDNLLAKIDKFDLQIIQTVTGSLVLKCQSLDTVRMLVESYDGDADFTLWTEINDGGWYLKCKTPALFGRFWNTAELAINGTRSRLQVLLKNQSKLEPDDKEIVREWLDMHPFDAVVKSHCSMVLVRDMGTRFLGQMTWEVFAAEFSALLHRTLRFQKLANLVHGDIHENNMLWNPKSSKGWHLVLIDWDEALKEKACFRKTESEEERLRYPSALVDFPQAYTQQQLLHLFDSLVNQYFSTSIASLDGHLKTMWNKVSLPSAVNRANVESRFKHLSKFLDALAKAAETK